MWRPPHGSLVVLARCGSRVVVRSVGVFLPGPYCSFGERAGLVLLYVLLLALRFVIVQAFLAYIGDVRRHLGRGRLPSHVGRARMWPVVATTRQLDRLVMYCLGVARCASVGPWCRCERAHAPVASAWRLNSDLKQKRQ